MADTTDLLIIGGGCAGLTARSEEHTSELHAGGAFSNRIGGRLCWRANRCYQ